jgi:hypothetical protein
MSIRPMKISIADSAGVAPIVTGQFALQMNSSAFLARFTRD